MTDRDSVRRRLSPATYVSAALLAALAGFGAVYLSWWSEGKRAAEPPVVASAPQSAAPAASAPKSDGLSGLNTGPMTPFVIKRVVEAVPAFTFKAADGADKTLQDWRGKVVLLNVWATWCAPCREEMPALDTLQKELGSDEFEVVAVSTDRGGSDKPKKFLEDAGATNLKLYQDPTGRLSQTLQSIGMPTTLLVDRQGRELGRLVGPAQWDSPEARRLIEAAIKADG